MRLKNKYFRWLCSFTICNDRPRKSYDKLLLYLFNREFIFTIELDENRWYDGINLRKRFGYDSNEPCSVLEMMVALANRCEESIMSNIDLGDRTDEWFWGMIENLGLGRMYDDKYDESYVEEIIDIFLNRDYSPNGEGGLFTINTRKDDMRDVEIWYQMCWYLDEILDEE